MKPNSQWQFSAPLEKVDLPRICDEAAEGGAALGAIKVVVDMGDGDIVFVMADSDLVARASEFKDLPLPGAVLARETGLRRIAVGAEQGPDISVNSLQGLMAIRRGGAILVFQCADEAAADRLVRQLVDMVVVRVEAF